MTDNAPLEPIGARVAALNRRHDHDTAASLLSGVLSDPLVGRIAMVSSFGAESVVLLHLVSIIDRRVPVLFIDTELLFAQTITYQNHLARVLGLRDVRRLHAARSDTFARDPDNMLHRHDPDACCALRKVAPLAQGLAGFNAWITGRKRFQSATRQDVALFEADGARIKVNPLARWSQSDVRDYIRHHDLPRHPLVTRGYASIGCKPCTSRVKIGEDPRAGRWRDTEKSECGIHFDAGERAHRGPAQ